MSARATGGRGRAWAELLRLPALFTVPGDALAGAAAVAARPNRGTLLATGASLSLYAAGMALNDWADRAEDARDRPHRPLPSGRVRPAHALAAASALTAAGLALAHRANRTTGAVATALAATVWAYDLRLKATPAGAATMGAARGLDLLMGATATAPTGARAGLAPALTLATHTTAVTTVSRTETQGGSTTAPLSALATGAAIATRLLATPRDERPRVDGPAPAAHPLRADHPAGATAGEGPPPRTAHRGPALAVALPTAAYAATAFRPLLHAALNPSPPLTQRAVGAGIRAMVPLQAALAGRAGAPVTALVTLGLGPLARRFTKRVSIT